MFKEGDNYSIDLVGKKNLEYEGFIRDKKIEEILEVFLLNLTNIIGSKRRKRKRL